jgi:hypothetical protein
LKDFAGFMIGKDEPEGLGFRPTKASKNAGDQKHTVSWGGQHGYFATIRVGRSADYSESKRSDCCGAILITLHHQSPRRNPG